MITPKTEDLERAERWIGARVSYRTSADVIQNGVITRVGKDYVFVLYDDHLNLGPMATRLADLTLIRLKADA